MDFSYTPEQEAFRMEVRRWLADNLPAELCVDDPVDNWVPPSREIFEKRRAWQAKMFAAGWVGIGWPREFGGRGASLIEQVIFNEEYGRSRAPILPGYSGISMCGPTIAQAGTDEQRRRFLKRILTGENIWCQGYSEPSAGSDLAAIQTRAEDRGDYFLLNGQKIWTSAAVAWGRGATWLLIIRPCSRARAISCNTCRYTVGISWSWTIARETGRPEDRATCRIRGNSRSSSEVSITSWNTP